MIKIRDVLENYGSSVTPPNIVFMLFGAINLIIHLSSPNSPKYFHLSENT